MEFKKCPRCGNFFHSELEVCQNCKTNENLDIQKLRNYFEENETLATNSTIQEISVQTGINSRNLNRFLLNDEFAGKINKENSNLNNNSNNN